MRLSSFSTISTTVKFCFHSSLYYCVVLVTEDATSLKKVLPFPYFRRFLRYLSVFNHV